MKKFIGKQSYNRKKNNTYLYILDFSIRAIGSAAMNLCMVAEGSCDAYFEYGIHIWDYGKNKICRRFPSIKYLFV